MSDAAFLALLAEAKRGGREALGTLFGHVRAELLAVAERSLTDVLRAKGSGADIVQDALLEALRLVARFEGESLDQFRAWMRAVVLNKAADFDRRYRRTEKRGLSRERPLDAGEGEGVAMDGPGPGTTVAQHEEQSRVTAAMARLPEEYRRVLRLRTWDAMTFADIGRRLDRSEDAARMLWVRAIERLRAELGGAE